jgi:hypothetical protein
MQVVDPQVIRFQETLDSVPDEVSGMMKNRIMLMVKAVATSLANVKRLELNWKQNYVYYLITKIYMTSSLLSGKWRMSRKEFCYSCLEVRIRALRGVVGVGVRDIEVT